MGVDEPFLATISADDLLRLLTTMEEQLQLGVRTDSPTYEEFVSILGALNTTVALRFRSMVPLYETLERVCRLAGADRVLIGLLNNFGLLMRVQGDLQRAKERFEEAVALSERLPDHPHLADCLHNLGMLCRTLGQTEVAIAHIERALSIKERQGKQEGIVPILVNLGLCLAGFGHYKRAIEYSLRALQLPAQTRTPLDDCIIRLNVGTYFRELGIPSVALWWHEQVFTYPDLYNLQELAAQAWYARGRDYEALGDYPHATENYIKALDATEEWMQTMRNSLAHLPSPVATTTYVSAL